MNQYYDFMPENISRKLCSICKEMEENDTEKYSHVLLSCRRLWHDMANYLFDEVSPTNKDSIYERKY